MSANQEIRARLDSQYRTLLILWLAFLSLFVIYYFLPVAIGRSLEHENRLLTIVFSAMCAFLVVLSFAVKNKFLSRSVETQDVSLVTTGFILAAALCEAGALVGLIDSLIANERYYFILIGFAMVGLVLHFPKRIHLEAASSSSISA